MTNVNSTCLLCRLLLLLLLIVPSSVSAFLPLQLSGFTGLKTQAPRNVKPMNGMLHLASPLADLGDSIAMIDQPLTATLIAHTHVEPAVSPAIGSLWLC